jgi:hypothetical protein
LKERSPTLPTALTAPLRFQLRDLLLATLLVGMALAWWRDHRQQASRLALYERQIGRFQAGGSASRRPSPLEFEEKIQGARRRSESTRANGAARLSTGPPPLPPPPGLDEFLKLVEHGSDSDYIAGLVAYSLSEPGEAAAPGLIDLLDHPRTAIRRRALESLGKLRVSPEIAVPAMIGRLSDSGDGVASAAAVALGRFGQDAQAALPALVAVMNDDDSPAAAAAAKAIYNIDSRDIGPRLIDLLESPHAGVRIHAAMILYEHSDPQLAERALIKAYASESDKSVQTAIIDALNQWRK